MNTRNAAMRRNQDLKIQPRIEMTEIRNGSEEKMMPLIWLYWLHAQSLVWIGQIKLKLLSENWISIFSYSDLDLNLKHLGSNPKLRLDVSYSYSKFGVNRSKQTKVIERKLNFHFSKSDLDLDHRHLGSNPKLCFEVSYPYSKFGVNRPKQTKVFARKLNFYFSNSEWIWTTLVEDL